MGYNILKQRGWLTLTYLPLCKTGSHLHSLASIEFATFPAFQGLSELLLRVAVHQKFEPSCREREAWKTRARVWMRGVANKIYSGGAAAGWLALRGSGSQLCVQPQILLCRSDLQSRNANTNSTIEPLISVRILLKEWFNNLIELVIQKRTTSELSAFAPE